MSNEIIRDKMLSPDGKLTLMVLALEPDATGPGRLAPIIGDVRNELKEIWPVPALEPNSQAFRSCSLKSAMRSSATA